MSAADGETEGEESIDEDELLEALEQEDDEWDGAVGAPAPDVARPKQSLETLGLYCKSLHICYFYPVNILGHLLWRTRVARPLFSKVSI